MHYTNDLPDGADLKAEAVAVIERIAQYMEKDVLLHHSRPLALAYLALTEEVDSVPVVRCKDCKHHYDCGVHFCNRLGMDCPDDSDFFCSYGERKDGGDGRGMAEMKRAKWVLTKKHLWYRDSHGEIDMYRLDYGYHNGPECQICGEAFCESCHKDWADKECSIGHYECSVCSEVSRDGHERFCPNCGAKMEVSADDAGD